MPDTGNALHAARLHADDSWRMFALARALPADTRPEWEQPTEGGLLSGRLVGSRPVSALNGFARDFHLHLHHLGDQRQQFDVTQPGRTVLVWRYGGVWVELWHPDTATDAPKAAQPTDGSPAAVQAAPKPDPEPVPVPRTERRRFSVPGGRLFFTRKSRTTKPKETTTR